MLHWVMALATMLDQMEDQTFQIPMESLTHKIIKCFLVKMTCATECSWNKICFDDFCKKKYNFVDIFLFGFISQLMVINSRLKLSFLDNQFEWQTEFSPILKNLTAKETFIYYLNELGGRGSEKNRTNVWKEWIRGQNHLKMWKWDLIWFFQGKSSRSSARNH